ncbi:MAG: AraC family transcriptional regulator ligand-binding domain-containing protein [Pseudomonadota bacterium]
MDNAVNEELINSYELKLIVRDLVTNQGVDPDALFFDTGVTLDDIEQIGHRLTLAQESALFEAVAGHNEDPILGLRIGRKLTLPNYGVLGCALMAAMNLDEALQLLNDFAPLVSWASHGQLLLEEERGVVCRSLTVFPMGSSAEACALEIDSTFASIQTLFNELAGGGVSFEAVHLIQRPSSSLETAYQEHYNCPVRFGQRRDKILVSRSVLNRALPHSQPENRELFRDVCRRMTEKRTGTRGLVAAVRNCIQSGEGNTPSLEFVADRFNRSSRTLRRQLQAAGMSYQAIVDDCRHRDACRLLTTTVLTTSSIADQLGYADSRCFRAAFKRWSGMTPSQYRAENSV